MSADTEFQRRLESFLHQEYDTIRDQLGRGVCLHTGNDISIEYANKVGYLKALESIGLECKEIAKQMNGTAQTVGRSYVADL